MKPRAGKCPREGRGGSTVTACQRSCTEAAVLLAKASTRKAVERTVLGSSASICVLGCNMQGQMNP